MRKVWYIIPFLLSGLAATAWGHYPPGEFLFAVQFPDDHLPVVDGNIAEWSVIPQVPYEVGNDMYSDALYSAESYFYNRNTAGDTTVRTFSQKRADLSIDADLLHKIKRTIGELVSGAQVVLYGSHSRGEEGPESDLDLLILLPDSAAPGIEEELDCALYDLELKHAVVLSTLVYRQSTWEKPGYRAIPLRQSIEREGVLL